MRPEKVFSAIQQVYGEVPRSWMGQTDQIMEFFSKVPKMYDLYETPPVTYMKFVTTTVRMDCRLYSNVVFSEKQLKLYINRLTELADEAMLQSKLDISNFEAEAGAFKSFESAVLKPHLEISALYRYIAAMKQALLFLVNADMQRAAIEDLRTNPYLFFSYGQDLQKYMPVTWEGI